MLYIFENKEDGYIEIKGRSIDGFKDSNVCNLCEKERYYSRVYDTYYCPSCDEWLEKTCGDGECEFCNSRPKKPSDLWEINK